MPRSAKQCRGCVSGFALLLICVALSTGCQRPLGVARSPRLSLSAPAELEVQQVLSAAPAELPYRFGVAFYTPQDHLAGAIAQMLESLPRVRFAYRIPPLLESGRRRFEPATQPRGPVDIRHLRLLAARVQAEVLLIFDYGSRVEHQANGLVVFSVALLPLLFMPMRDVHSECYLDGYAVDTRTGQLRGQLSAHRSSEESFVTLYSSRGEGLLAEQHRPLLDSARAQLLALPLMALPSGSSKGAVSTSARPSLALLDTQDPWAAQQIEVALAGNDAMQLDGQQVTTPRLAAAINKRLRAGRTVQVRVRLESTVSHERALELIGLLKKLGVKEMSLHVDWKPQKEPSGPAVTRTP